MYYVNVIAYMYKVTTTFIILWTDQTFLNWYLKDLPVLEIWSYWDKERIAGEVMLMIWGKLTGPSHSYSTCGSEKRNNYHFQEKRGLQNFIVGNPTVGFRQCKIFLNLHLLYRIMRQSICYTVLVEYSLIRIDNTMQCSLFLAHLSLNILIFKLSFLIPVRRPSVKNLDIRLYLLKTGSISITNGKEHAYKRT